MRRKDVDWLRLFGIFLLFPFHTARCFDSHEANYVENGIRSLAGETFMNVIGPWFMPLLFLVAGVSAYYALQKRSSGAFAKERVRRLHIPLVFGILFIVPIQGYMARLQEGTLNGGYFNYLFTQFFPDFSDMSGYHGTFTPAHLWFILFLFMISMILIPVFAAVLKARKEKGVGWFGKLFGSGTFLLLLFLFVTLSEVFPEIGGKNIVFYGVYYAIGFFIASNETAWKAIDKIRYWALGLCALSIPLFLYLQGRAAGMGDYSIEAITLAFARNLYAMSAILAMMAFAQRYLNKGGKVLDYLSQAAFPVYIFHQSVLIVIAYFVVQWPIAVWGKFLIIMFSTIIASFVLYEICRRIQPLRFALGIKQSNRKAKLSTGTAEPHKA